MAQLVDFSGGLNTRVNPALIGISEAVLFSNVDIEEGSLKPLKESFNESQNFGANASFIFFNGSWIAKPSSVDYIEYQEKLYFSDAVGVPQKTSDGITFFNLGINKPPTPPITTYNGVILETDTASTRQYCYTYFNSADGTESMPSDYSAEVSYVLDNITISNITISTDPQVTSIKIYRLGGDLTEMSLVTTIAKTSISYIDTLSDIAIDGAILTSYNGGMPPAGLRFMIEHNSMFFGALGDKLYYSDVAYINSWSPFFFIDFDDIITGIGSTPNGLLVFTKIKTYIITGTSPLLLTKILLHSTQGCINHKTIKFVDNMLLWLSLDGICSSNGGVVKVITIDKLGKLRLVSIDSDIWDNQYYLFHTTGILVIDFRYGQAIFKNIAIIGNGCWYSNVFDKLYYITTAGTLYSLYEGIENLSYHWKSGKLTEGLLTSIKTYKTFYVYSEGESSLLIYIDGNLSITYNLITGLNEVKIPQEDSRGYYCELEIIGSSIIREIEYKIEGRQNGR